MWIDSRPWAGWGHETVDGPAAGFSLLDLLCALAIAGLLAAIAVPSYRAHLVRANRAEARQALMSLAADQEQFYLECHAYAARLDGTNLPSCGTSTLGFPAHAGGDSYALDITAADATGWTATATVVPGSPQASDLRCRLLQIDGTGARTAQTASGDSSDEECWSR